MALARGTARAAVPEESPRALVTKAMVLLEILPSLPGPFE